MSYAILFEPIKIGPVTIKNRLALAPTNTNYSDNHLVGDQTLAWYATRARGGLGLLIFEATPVSPKAAETSIYNIHHFWGPEHTPGMHRLVEAVHSYGAKIFIQLSPGLGIQAAEKGSGVVPCAPSSVGFKCESENIAPKLVEWLVKTPNTIFIPEGESPVPMSEEEINNRIVDFGRACKLAVNTGFDGVEIHSPHGYLIHDFLSPRYNKRTDSWGGSLGNRMRFFLRIVEVAKTVIQDRIALGARLSIDERNEDGIHCDEMKLVARAAVEAGIDYLHVSDGCYEQSKYFLPDRDGAMNAGAAGFREATGIPVMTPSLHNPDHAAQAVKDGITDMVSSSRAFIADPEWANKVKEGKTKAIRKCTRCNRCIFELFQGHALRCSVNKYSGTERFKISELLTKTVSTNGLAGSKRGSRLNLRFQG